MTDEQKDALEWLEEAHVRMRANEPYRSTIKAMLAEPRLPEVPSETAINVMAMEIGAATETDAWRATAREAYAALYAHLTKPATGPHKQEVPND